MEKVIRRALISVYHKDGLAEILALLHKEGVEFVSTGGTSAFIESLGYPCVAVEDLTKYPSMLGGRVKTLHPAIQGGILARRSHETDQKEVAEYGLSLIDLVIVDLYPFEATVASGASEEDIIEKIDIGGISLIRGAAKNFEDVVIVPSQADYSTLHEILSARGARTTLQERRHFARRAFAVSSHYDSAIFRYFDGEEHSALRLTADGAKHLRYGENPHQQGVFYGDLERYFEQLHGKELSYNNLQDIEAAVSLIQDFSEPTFAILKHNNACGCASRPTLLEAWQAALAGDPVSAFGGVLVTNRPVDLETAEEINKLFFEVLIAPDFTEEALPILESKKNRILLRQREAIHATWSYRSMLGGVLVHGDAAAVVDDPEAAVGLDGDLDVVAVAGQGLVDGVVHDLVHQVVQPALAGGADVHAGPLADGLQPLEDGDVAGTVASGPVGGVRGHSSVLSHVFVAPHVGRVRTLRGVPGPRAART